MAADCEQCCHIPSGLNSGSHSIEFRQNGFDCGLSYFYPMISGAFVFECHRLLPVIFYITPFSSPSDGDILTVKKTLLNLATFIWEKYCFCAHLIGLWILHDILNIWLCARTDAKSVTPLTVSGTAVMHQCGKIYSTYNPSAICIFNGSLNFVFLWCRCIYIHMTESESIKFQVVFAMFKSVWSETCRP
jgi:hypothetical protein